jgi:hypothetical protein
MRRCKVLREFNGIQDIDSGAPVGVIGHQSIRERDIRFDALRSQRDEAASEQNAQDDSAVTAAVDKH